MFVSRHDEAAVAMEEIEVISMDGGEDNVTTLALPPPPSASVMASPSSPHWIEPSSSSDSSHSPPSREAQAMDTLLSMMANEEALPAIDPQTRSRVKATPITSTAAAEEDDEPVNDHDRTKMCDWYYEMSDFLKIDRSTASRSLTLLDRFMATPVHRHAVSRLPSSDPHTVPGVVVAASQDRDEYQLAALTALFLAVKLFERLNVQPDHVSYLSRGRYTSSEVVKMEVVMLAALEWKACTADKVDYIDAFLDVLLPRSTSSCSSEDETDAVAKGLQDLANLQIQLSDFDSSFATKKRSTVAFAAVINAFEMKKDCMSEADQHLFLKGVQKLMHKMHASDGPSRQREELARTVEALRVLVDPPSASGGSVHSTPSVNLTPTTYQRYHQQPSLEISTHAQVSPLEVALESMENFDVTKLFCCGGDHHAAPGRTFHEVHTDGDDDMIVEENPPVKIETVSSFGSSGSCAGNEKRGRSNRSPTSIATILFGK
ncbi:hypothetical protein ACHAXT_010900 [Thalassiosira profunda]